MAFSPDSMFLAFAPYGGGLHLLKIDNPNPILILKDPQIIYSLAFAPDGTTFAVGFEREHKIEFRRVPDGMLLDTLMLSGVGSVNNLAYSPDGNFLALSRHDRIEIWDLSHKTLVHSLTGIGYSIEQVRFSPNGNIVATGQTTAQWNGIDGRQLQSLHVRGDTFSLEANLVVSLQGEKAHFYRMTDGKLMRTLRFSTYLFDAAFSADGKLVAVTGEDGTIAIFGIP
jgi:WD40 repeat protein